jgi:hypothetical protein
MAIARKAFNVGLVLVLILILLKIVFIDSLPFGKDNSSFAVEQDKIVSKIELTRENENLVLKIDKGVWTVNGISGVSKSEIIAFLSLLYEIQIKSPVSDDAFNKLIVEPGIEPVKVRIFVKNRMHKTFLVYKTDINVYGNIMKTSEKAKPFIVYAPGFEDNIGSFFEMNEQSWLSKTIFNLMPSEIQSVEVKYSTDNESFTIENKGRSYIISDSNGVIGNVDSIKVFRYLSYFTYIPFEKWAFEISQEEKSRITVTVPEVIISVSTKTGLNTVLSVWERRNIVDNAIILDTDRVWGRLDKSDNIFIMRYFDIDPILKKREYFIKK